MLYVTTRNNQETFTAQRVLSENRGPDGGMYLPFQEPRLELPEGASMNQTIAQLLNLFFQTRLTAWDVDFTIGRYPVRLVHLRQKTVMAETWHNPNWTFGHLVKNLSNLVSCREDAGGWTEIAIRIAVLTGILTELKPQEPVDLAMVSGDFAGPISAWYARAWGLPIGNIICCCNENNALWDLLTLGQLRTDGTAIQTCLPQADVVVPEQLERLISAVGGREETARYLYTCSLGAVYCPDEAVLSHLREGLFASVVSSQRMDRIIRGAYGTHDYLLSPASALAYGGLMDYRARVGTMRQALVMTEESPRLDPTIPARALGLREEDLKTM